MSDLLGLLMSAGSSKQPRPTGQSLVSQLRVEDSLMYTGPMEPVLAGFDDELQKLASRRMSDVERQQRALNRDLRGAARRAKRDHPLDSLRGKSSPRQRDYLASAGIAALTYPLLGVLGAKIGRGLRNRATLKAMQGVPRLTRKKLRRKLETGPLIASSHLKKKTNQLSREDLAVRAAQGGIVGSLVMALRDRFAGSIPTV